MFASALPATGVAGWNYIQRTEGAQLQRLNKTPEVSKAIDYAAAALPQANTAGAILEDRKLLEIVLTALGLEDRINDGALLKKVLTEGGTDEDALAKRLGDSELIEFANLFSFDKGSEALSEEDMAALLADYSHAKLAQSIEVQDEGLATALRALKAFTELGQSDLSSNGMWFTIIGDDDMRKTIQTALQLSDGFFQLDLDKQADRLDKMFRSRFGEDITAISDEAFLDELMTRSVAMSAIDTSSSMSSSAIALSLFQSQGSIDIYV